MANAISKEDKKSLQAIERYGCWLGHLEMAAMN